MNLVLNSNNVVSGSSNTRYSYTVLNSNLTILDEAELCVSNITLPYSWFNVTTAYNNRTFNVIWYGGGTILSVPFTLQEGFYTITDINAALQQFMILNGMYLINAQGNYVYYFTFLYNQSTYGVQFIASLVPTSLPSGWTQPAGFLGYPPTASTGYITLLSTSNFFRLIGFENGKSYPNNVSATARSFLSTSIPVGSNVNSLIIRCTLVNNEAGFPSDILDTMPITGTFGSNLNYSPPALKWVKLSSGTFQKLEIQFVDQNLNAMTILDNNVCISLLLKNIGEETKELFIEAPTSVGEDNLGSTSKLIFRD